MGMPNCSCGWSSSSPAAYDTRDCVLRLDPGTNMSYITRVNKTRVPNRQIVCVHWVHVSHWHVFCNIITLLFCVTFLCLTCTFLPAISLGHIWLILTNFDQSHLPATYLGVDMCTVRERSEIRVISRCGPDRSSFNHFRPDRTVFIVQ